MRERERPGLLARALLGSLHRSSSSKEEPHTPSGPYVPIQRPHFIPSSSTPKRKVSSYQPPSTLPPSLPRRKKSLTLPPGVLNNQAQSTLLSLPAELLSLIYQHIIGSQTIHIFRLPGGKLGHASCLAAGDTEACFEAQCSGMKLPSGLTKPHSVSDNLLPLVRSCRKAYTLILSSLYTNPTYALDSLESLITFSLLIPPKRFDSIHHLSLDFRFALSHLFNESNPSNDSARWVRTWQVIGSMKSLSSLRVRITWPYPKFSAIEEKRFLVQLWMVHGLGKSVFVVSLPPAWEGKEVDWEDSPFSVERRKH